MVNPTVANTAVSAANMARFLMRSEKKALMSITVKERFQLSKKVSTRVYVPTNPVAKGPTLTSCVFVGLNPSSLTIVGRNSASPSRVVPFINNVMKTSTTWGDDNERKTCLNEKVSTGAVVGRSRTSRLTTTLKTVWIEIWNWLWCHNALLSFFGCEESYIGWWCRDEKERSQANCYGEESFLDIDNIMARKYGVRRRLTNKKIQAHPGLPWTPSIFMIAAASNPENAPAREAAEKNSATLII